VANHGETRRSTAVSTAKLDPTHEKDAQAREERVKRLQANHTIHVFLHAGMNTMEKKGSVVWAVYERLG